MALFHLLRLKNTPIFRQLQIEEALLRADAHNWCIVNEGSEPAVVMGISGKIEQFIDSEELARAPVPIIRRFSGGGTVIVDEQTTFITWIGNADELQIPCCPKRILEWTATLYENAFAPADFRLIENDYAIGNRKCGGNAQYMRKGRWLHHTSFLWDYREERMRLLRMPPKTPDYRRGRTHEEFLCRLKDHFTDDDSFVERALSKLGLKVEFTPASLADAESVLLLPHRQATERLF